MKKFIKLSLICLISGFFFTSCNSKMLVTKRLYNDGYHVSYNNGKSNKDLQKNKKEEVAPKAEVHSSDAVVYNDQVALDAPVAVEQQSNTQVNTSRNETSFVEKMSKAPIYQKITEKAKSIEKAITPEKKNTCSVNEASDKTDDAYSLLWILVLVLVILWALGYLAGGLGLGGLINILLVIALILLILWLLRVV